MAEVCCHLPKGGRGSAATYSCAPEIRQTALPGLEGKAGLKGQQELAHPGDHASLTASCDHIQVLGSACPPNPGGAGVLSQAGCQSPFLTGLPIGDLLLSSPPPLSEVSHSPLFCGKSPFLSRWPRSGMTQPLREHATRVGWEEQRGPHG